jgi:hypothetical protein
MFALIRLPDQSIINTYQHKDAAIHIAEQFQEYAPEGTTYIVHTAYVMVPMLERVNAAPVRTLADDKVVVLPPSASKRHKEQKIPPTLKTQIKHLYRPGSGRHNILGKKIIELRQANPKMKQIDIAKAVGCHSNYVHAVLKKAGLNARA